MVHGGYCTPIYMPNRAIRLQAVLEIITNQTASALEMLTQQQNQMRAAISQNRLALDYLLAEEGAVCGKFNISNCCLFNTRNNGKVVLEIASNIRKVARVSVQTWKGWDPTNLLGGCFSNLGGFKMLVGTVIFITGVLLFLPCVVPLKLLLKLQLTARQSRRCSCYSGTMDTNPSLKNTPKIKFFFFQGAHATPMSRLK
uniref:Endogenous retrovirus group 48 member 1, envelope n=1 Tax=Pongo abelii TaxID=9601 RepID=A0A8I5YPI5_PONAB